jgi:hypothetical protein
VEFSDVLVQSRRRVRDRRARIREQEDALALERQSLAVEEEDLVALERVAQGLGIIVIDVPDLFGETTWSGKDRTAAVCEILDASIEPMRPADISEALKERGRSDDNEQVSATLAHLKRSGRATSVGRARWVSSSSPLAATADRGEL